MKYKKVYENILLSFPSKHQQTIIFLCEMNVNPLFEG